MRKNINSVIRLFAGIILTCLVFAVGTKTVSAYAADTVKLSAKTKTLFLGGSKGKTSDGKKCETGATKNISKMVLINDKAFSTKTYKLKLEVKNEAVVTASGNTITAVGIGKTDVKVTVYKKSNNKKVGKTMTLSVTVKKNASEVLISGIENNDSFFVGDSTLVYLPTSDDGVTLDTDKRKLKVTNSDGKAKGVTVTKVKGMENFYKLSFESAGKYTLTASAYQSSDYSGTTASKKIKFEVKKVPAPTPTPTPSPTPLPTPTPVPTDPVDKVGYLGVTQTGPKSFTMNFASNPSSLGIKAADIEIYTIDVNKNKSLMSWVLTSAPKVSGNKVVVNVSNAFERAREYFIGYAGRTFSFVAVGETADDIARVVINDATIVSADSYAEAKVSKSASVKLSCTFYNALGTKLNVSPYVFWEKVEASSDDIIYSDGYVYMQKTGDKLKMNAYVYIDKGFGELVRIDADSPKTFTAVDYETTNGVQKGVIISSSASSAGVSSGNSSLSFIPTADSNTSNKYFFFEYFYQVKTVGSSSYSYVNGRNRGCTYAIADTSIADIFGGNQIIPGTKEGTTEILVYDKNGNVIYVHKLVVKYDRKPTRYQATLSKNTLNVNPAAGDKVYMTIEVFDQNGNPYTDSKFAFKITGGNTSAGFVVSGSNLYTDPATGIATIDIGAYAANYLMVGGKTTVALTITPLTSSLSGNPSHTLYVENTAQ